MEAFITYIRTDDGFNVLKKVFGFRSIPQTAAMIREGVTPTLGDLEALVEQIRQAGGLEPEQSDSARKSAEALLWLVDD